MSLYKRIFMDNDPAYAGLREEVGRQVRAHIDQFKFRLAWNLI